MQTSGTKILYNILTYPLIKDNIIELYPRVSNGTHIINTYPINKKADFSKNLYKPNIIQLSLTQNHKNIVTSPKSKL
jgi:hypothetical protein